MGAVGDHSVGLKHALKNWEGTEPDLLLITEDGSKVFTKSIILSMYSKVFSDIIAEYKTPEMPTISLSIASSPPVLNLLKILTEGIVLSTDSNALLEVGKVAQLLDIKLEGMQLGSRKTSAKNKKREEPVLTVVDENPPGNEEVETRMEDSSTASDDGLEQEGEIEADIKPELSEISTNEDEESKVIGQMSIARGQKNCTECGKIFSTKQALERHFMIHTGERPYKCDQCDKAFTTPFSMKQHKVTHSDVKPFSCHCGAQFTLKASLKRHEEKGH